MCFYEITVRTLTPEPQGLSALLYEVRLYLPPSWFPPTRVWFFCLSRPTRIVASFAQVLSAFTCWAMSRAQWPCWLHYFLHVFSFWDWFNIVKPKSWLTLSAFQYRKNNKTTAQEELDTQGWSWNHNKYTVQPTQTLFTQVVHLENILSHWAMNEVKTKEEHVPHSKPLDVTVAPLIPVSWWQIQPRLAL